MWPFCEGTISILTLCICLISRCRWNWPNLWGVTREEFRGGNEALNLGRFADGHHQKRKPLTLLSWKPGSPSFAHPIPHQTLSRESERWFNFHTGSPHALGCQMWQITCVGILVWSSVHWVRADSSSSFNLSQMDLEPGAKGLKFSPLKHPPYSQTFHQGRSSC